MLTGNHEAVPLVLLVVMSVHHEAEWSEWAWSSWARLFWRWDHLRFDMKQSYFDLNWISIIFLITSLNVMWLTTSSLICKFFIWLSTYRFQRPNILAPLHNQERSGCNEEVCIENEARMIIYRTLSTHSWDTLGAFCCACALRYRCRCQYTFENVAAAR